ncbi:unnamed protein product [Didymodactylos carnosus]|uniref:Uncharacterized protein n=1 Tax=Didymodactylos carnosus TaxID=1234261 RepID=A0A8S2E7R7_9BILA|nr:unnamed protein product [Didymodactylos carnosus]CAF3953474.1 unnamed protein product [Didymodactylos carnosus]
MTNDRRSPLFERTKDDEPKNPAALVSYQPRNTSFSNISRIIQMQTMLVSSNVGNKKKFHLFKLMKIDIMLAEQSFTLFSLIDHILFNSKSSTEMPELITFYPSGNINFKNKNSAPQSNMLIVKLKNKIYTNLNVEIQINDLINEQDNRLYIFALSEIMDEFTKNDESRLKLF